MSSNTIALEQTSPTGRLMAHRFLLLLSTCCFALGAHAASLKMEKPEVGFIEVKNESNQLQAYLHTRVPLANIRSVLTQYSGKDDKDACCKRVNPNELVEIPLPESVAAGGDELMHSYRINSDAFNLTGAYLGIAAINSDALKPTKAGMFASQKNGSKIQIKSCYSNEGFHVVKWKLGKPVEDLYFYLNADLEGNCKETDFPAATK